MSVIALVNVTSIIPPTAAAGGSANGTPVVFTQATLAAFATKNVMYINVKCNW